MEIYEKINHLIKQKKITKRKFADILQNLNPKLKSTGEIPNEKTIYKYLSGDINIPIELISYIAKALDITEQELFDTDTQTKMKLYKYLTNDLQPTQLSYIDNLSTNSSIVKEVQTKFNQKKPSNLTYFHEQELEKLLSLLEFAPKPFIEKITKRLEEIKEISIKDI